MNWLIFLTCCLAVFRLSLLVSKEDGPAWIFRKLRNAPPKKSSAHEGIRCQWCVSVWASAPVTAYCIWLGLLKWPEAPLYWLAFSAGAICINQAFTADA